MKGRYRKNIGKHINYIVNDEPFNVCMLYKFPEGWKPVLTHVIYHKRFSRVRAMSTISASPWKAFIWLQPQPRQRVHWPSTSLWSILKPTTLFFKLLDSKDTALTTLSPSKSHDGPPYGWLKVVLGHWCVALVNHNSYQLTVIIQACYKLHEWLVAATVNVNRSTALSSKRSIWLAVY